MKITKVKVIAEIGWNHMGDSDLAEQMIAAAKDSGASTVKFQFWDPQYLKEGAWDVDGRREIYNKAALTTEKIKELQALCIKYHCDFLISVFGTIGAKKMHDLGIREIKIPSHETTNLKLIEYCAKNFDFIYFSAGASSKDDVLKALEILNQGCAKYNLMHCVSSYPCNPENANLLRLTWLKSLHPEIGYSDHTQSTMIPSIAISMGASVIEKHFTTDKNLPGRDNKFALNPQEFKVMTDLIHDAELSLIDHGTGYQDIESDTVSNYRGRWEPADYQ